MLTDIRRLASSNVSSSQDLVVEASSRVQGAQSLSQSLTSSSRAPDSSSVADWEVSGQGPERVLPLAQVAPAAPRVLKIKRKKALKRRNVPGSRSSDFVPSIPRRLNDPQDLEEEEQREREAGLLDSYVARKRKRQVSSSGESDAAPVPSKDQPTADGSSGDRAITIPCSPELGPTIGLEPELSESNEDDLAPRALQIIPPSDQGEGSQSKPEFMRSGLPKSKRLDQVITHNYIPPRGTEPPRIEISAPWEEEVRKILRCWEPYHRGESAATRLNDLYPTMYRVPFTARGMGLHETYTVPVPVSSHMEDFLQIIDDGIQVRNHNFIQSTKLVRWVIYSGESIVITFFH